MTVLPLAVPTLHLFTTLRISGTDARTFLQGQLSNDTKKLSASQAQLSSVSSAQGRVQAVLTLVQCGDDIVILLPPVMRQSMMDRLQRFVLRAKITIEREPLLQLAALSADQAKALFTELPTTPGGVLQRDDLCVLRWWSADERYVLIAPPERLQPAPQEACHAWRQADIAAGLPQVYPETHEHFVAQMLNLDVLNGISFNKGCYTGQEIIARTHYRGTIKRRMLRFQAACTPPSPGERIVRGEQPAGEVVEAIDTPFGCELLAVMSLDQVGDASAQLQLRDSSGPTLQSLSLPYTFPAQAAASQA